MRIHLCLLVIFFFCLSILNGQNKDALVIIEYDYKTRVISDTPYQINSILLFNSKASLYEMDHTNSFKKNKKFINEENKGIIMPSKGNEFVFKSFINGEIDYSERINFSFFRIQGTLDTLFQWSLKSNFKEILGYKCQEARTNYGGREYIAYFTTDFPVAIPNGPWHFHGLPGVILEVKSVDKIFELEALAIEIKNDSKVEIENPFDGQESMTWDDFLILYQEKYDQVLRNSMTEWGPTNSLPKKNIVEYIKEDN
jgi:GLPGLI family protein